MTIAGSDPSGGAGVQADLKTFYRFGVYGEAIITLLTVQNAFGVKRVEVVDADLVSDQIAAALEDITPGAAKTGALGNAGVVRAVAGAAKAFRFPLVVDPVLVSTSGAPLLDRGAVGALDELLALAALVTPNLAEAEALSERPVGDPGAMRRAAEAIRGRYGSQAVLVKGGHLEGRAVDVLVDGEGFVEFSADRIGGVGARGTGCAYSAAITALLAHGRSLRDAIEQAKEFITSAIGSAPKHTGGRGPLNHFA